MRVFSRENGWKSNNNNEDGLTQVETCDVTFVDDEALFLERKSPDQLVEDTGKVLAAVSGTFRRCGLKLNWRPGKSEILVSLRGTGATKVREDKLRQPDGSLAMWALRLIPLETWHDRWRKSAWSTSTNTWARGSRVTDR